LQRCHHAGGGDVVVRDQPGLDGADRILLNPHAAKRLLQMLANSIDEYERQYGPLG